MPRQPRLDSPGSLHHVIARGIESREIFADDVERGTFVYHIKSAVDLEDIGVAPDADPHREAVHGVRAALAIRTISRPVLVMPAFAALFAANACRCGE